jgi:hypothetical protein
VDGDHVTMVKFKGRYDPRYSAVVTKLIHMMHPSPPLESSSDPGVSRSSTLRKLPEGRTDDVFGIRNITKTDTGISSFSTPFRRNTQDYQNSPPSSPNIYGFSRVSTDATAYRPNRAPTESGLSNWQREHTSNKSTASNRASGTFGGPGSNRASSAAQSNHTSWSDPTSTQGKQREGPLISSGSAGMEIHSREDDPRFAKLKLYDTVFILDDSSSMMDGVKDKHSFPSCWDELVVGMGHIGSIAAKYDEDGIDIYFLNTKAQHKNICTGEEILGILSGIDMTIEGKSTLIEPKLRPILENHVVKVKNYKLLQRECPDDAGDPPKPLNVIVITDGMADDADDVEDVLVQIARQLDLIEARPHQIGVQFVQIGLDQKAATWLKTLDDNLRDKFHIRDVSVLPFGYVFFLTTLV